MFDEENAKAIKSVADLGTKALETSEKVGGFFARVFKEPIEQISGMVSDKLKFARWQRLMDISDNVNQILQNRGIEETRAVTPRLALPLFQEASLEERDELQKLWDVLLANAMDPNFNDELRYGFIDMIKNITAREVQILNLLYNTLEREGKINNIEMLTGYFITKEQILTALSINAADYSVSAYNLMRMQCIGPAVIEGGLSFGSHKATSYKGIEAIILTPLGAKFVQACIK